MSPSLMPLQPYLGSGHTTHPSLHLRDARDALVVFEAVRIGVLPLIKRRLTSDERDQLSSGNVFVWEEAEHKGGLERWTDGRRWSQSRMKGEYLFYEEKVETTEEERQAKAARRASRNAGNPVQHTPTRRQDRPAKPDGLTKQTYSTHVYSSSSSSPRKWHVVAYFSGNDYTRLPLIENFDYLRRIRVPEGVFFSARGQSKKLEGEDDDGTSPEPYLDSPTFRQHGRLPGEPTSAIQNSYTVPGQYLTHYTPQSPTESMISHRTSSRLTSHDPSALPRLSTIAPLPPPNHFPPFSSSASLARGTNGITTGNFPLTQPPSPQNYRPLSPEDRRALSTFKIVL